MPRHHADWLNAYLDYHSVSESPRRVRFWCGVSAIAGALRRKVWIDQIMFKWYPNFYIILVAKPGVVSKSTTVDIGMRLLREVPGIKFGPDVVTWEALVECFEGAREAFEFRNQYHAMSPITLESSEFGNLLDPQNRAMVDLYVSLWDGKEGGFNKITKTSGSNQVINPWINLIACTTPAWIAGSFPEYMIGGGFTSRCLFIYAEEKERFIANPRRHIIRGEHEGLRATLIEDLAQIASLTGEYEMTEEALDWTDAWYEAHYKNPPAELNDERFGGYLARKQSHMYKLAMVIAAARGDSLSLTAQHFKDAYAMVSSLEPDMVKVFSRIGRTEDMANTEKLLSYIRRYGPIEFVAAYQHVHQNFPRLRNFDEIMAGLGRAGLIQIAQGRDGKQYLTAPPPAVKTHLS